MDKKHFQAEYDKIEVPSEDVIKAIQNGMMKANQDGIAPIQNKRRKSTFIFSVVATLFISSSFISPTLSHVMADVPVLGNLYGHFNDLVGRSLSAQQLITELNETARSKGIDVTITSAYYDGAVIGVTFHVEGNVKSEENGKLMAIYEIFDGKEGISDSKEVVYMEPSGNGYSGSIQLNYPKAKLPADTTFPLEFKNIGDNEGNWKFNVPIKQLDFDTIATNVETSNKNADIQINFDSVIAANASTSINYTATFPKEKDQLRLEVYDDKGNVIPLLSDGIDLDSNKTEEHITVLGRTIIPESLKGKTDYLEIHPKVALFEEDQFIKLDQQTPLSISLNRQNLSVNVEKMNLQEDTFSIDFQVNNGNIGNWDLNFFKDYANNDITLVKETEKKIYEKPIEHSITVLDEKTLRFRSTFDISTIKNFNMEDYIIRVNLYTLSANIPLELEPVKIILNEN